MPRKRIRRVRTREGEIKFGLPKGAIITADAIERAKTKRRGKPETKARRKAREKMDAEARQLREAEAAAAEQREADEAAERRKASEIDEIEDLLGGPMPSPSPSVDPTPEPEPWQDRYRSMLENTGDALDAATDYLPTSLVARYAEYDREETGGEALDILTETIDRDGIRSPLRLSTDGNTAIVHEGNHRLAAAQRLGLREVPVEITFDQQVRVNEGTPVPVDDDLRAVLRRNAHTLRDQYGNRVDARALQGPAPDVREIAKLDPDAVDREEFERMWSEALNGRYGGLNFQVTDASNFSRNPEEGDLGGSWFRGDILDDEGNKVGVVEQRYEIDWRGDVHVRNEAIEIEDADARGKGFGSAFGQRLDEINAASDAASINVHAALEDGGYVWARDGYDWDRSRRSKSIANVRGRLERVRDSMPADDADRDVLDGMIARLGGDFDDPDFPTPQEIAALRGHGGRNLGREVMRGSNWYGVKTLREVDQGPMREYPDLEQWQSDTYLDSDHTRAMLQRAFDGVYPDGHVVEVTEGGQVGSYDYTRQGANWTTEAVEFEGMISDADDNLVNSFRARIDGWSSDLEFDDLDGPDLRTVTELQAMFDHWTGTDGRPPRGAVPKPRELPHATDDQLRDMMAAHLQGHYGDEDTGLGVRVAQVQGDRDENLKLDQFTTTLAYTREGRVVAWSQFTTRTDGEGMEIADRGNLDSPEIVSGDRLATEFALQSIQPELGTAFGRWPGIAAPAERGPIGQNGAPPYLGHPDNPVADRWYQSEVARAEGRDAEADAIEADIEASMPEHEARRGRIIMTAEERLQDAADHAGMDPEEIVRIGQEGLRQFLDGKQVAVAVDEDAVDAILNDGRFRSQRERGAIRGGGTYMPSTRELLENAWFGEHDWPPIFGFFRDPNGADSRAHGYGDVVFVFNDDVRDRRSTASVGDSLGRRDHVFPGPATAPGRYSFDPEEMVGLDDITPEGYAAFLNQGTRPGEFSGFYRDEYVEAQIHGGLPITDVTEVIFRHQVSAEMYGPRLEALGIPFRVEGRDDFDGRPDEGTDYGI